MQMQSKIDLYFDRSIDRLSKFIQFFSCFNFNNNNKRFANLLSWRNNIQKPIGSYKCNN